MTEPSAVSDIIKALIGSFAGATFAFLLAGRRVKQDERKRQMGAINRSVVILFNMHSNLETYRQDVIEQFEKRDDAWLNAPVKPAKSWGAIRFDADGMAFLLEEKQPQLYCDFVLHQCNFDEVSQLIEMRDKLLIEHVHEKLGALLAQPVPEDELVKTMGPHVASQLKQLWSGITGRVTRQIAANKKMHDDLRDVAVKLFPGHLPLKTVFFDGLQDEQSAQRLPSRESN